MNNRSAADINDLVARARDLAHLPDADPSTGYLLLAILTGSGTAARTLSLRGLTETMVRVAVRENDPEPPDLRGRVERKAQQYADSLGAAQPSALHLLAALATVRECQAHRILTGAGLDTDVIRNQALRCLTTGFTREHGPADPYVQNLRAATASRGEALPLIDGLTRPPAPAAPPEPSALRAPAPPSAEAVRPGAAYERVRPIQALIGVGESLERAQRKTRQLRSSAKNPALAAAAIEEPFEEPAVLPAVAPPPTAGRRRRPVTGAPRRRPAASGVARFVLSPDEFPLLATVGRNLTEEARVGRLDEIVGRQREMEQMADVLNKRRANSPCLVGPPGVGKTAIVEGLALGLVAGRAPGLEERVIVEVRPVDLLSGTSLRGALSERLTALREEVAAADGRVILFFDEIHALLASNDGAEAIQELKAALGRGELPCIAATTNDEYARHVEADPALARRFTTVEVAEPSEEEAQEILTGIAPVYAAHHQVDFDADAITAAVRLSARYVPDRALPDKAIALLDLAGARARRSGIARVERADIAAVLAEQIGVPTERLTIGDRERLLSLEDELTRQIVGHEHVLEAIGETLRRNAAGFRSGRPIGSFLFLGPTGVGKTETAKALARLLFPGGDALVRLDMTEFSEAHAVARLVGAPPGYIGHEDGGQLTEAVRRRPYCLVLLDEIEKAHRDVIQLLLQVLDDGRLTDGRGRTVVLQNTVIVMTSNLGADLREIGARRRRVGFGAPAETEPATDVATRIRDGARASLPPELWNRIDEPLVFEPLTRGQVARIAELMIAGISAQLEREHRIRLALGPGAVQALIDAGGFDAELGARPMRRTIQRLVEGPIARMVLADEIASGASVTILGDEDHALSFEVD